jgi:hypothetical protein
MKRHALWIAGLAIGLSTGFLGSGASAAFASGPQELELRAVVVVAAPAGHLTTLAPTGDSAAPHGTSAINPTTPLTPASSQSGSTVEKPDTTVSPNAAVTAAEPAPSSSEPTIEAASLEQLSLQPIEAGPMLATIPPVFATEPSAVAPLIAAPEAPAPLVFAGTGGTAGNSGISSAIPAPSVNDGAVHSLTTDPLQPFDLREPGGEMSAGAAVAEDEAVHTITENVAARELTDDPLPLGFVLIAVGLTLMLAVMFTGQSRRH